MAPFSYYRSVLQKEHSRVTSDDGLERCSVGDIERILSPRDVAPVVYALLVAGREPIKVVTILFRILVNLVYIAEIGVVGLLEVGGNEQECVSLGGNNILRDVLSCCGIRYREVARSLSLSPRFSRPSRDL